MIAVISGSNRKGSASAAACRYLRGYFAGKGRETVFCDLRERPLPFFSPDEPLDGHPDVGGFRRLVQEASGVVLGTPEYHGSVSGLLKNALDHLGETSLAGKVVLSVSASGGPLGTSALAHLQQIVRTVHGVNCPEWISVGGGNKFGPGDEPENPKTRDRIHKASDAFLLLVDAISGKRP